ncbi:hypothetical protein SEA_NEFERTHENA_54 [Microbacterium phage Neferthena]|uniref:Uncharacterized protein n=1 Tax=Microbacterium phage Neferthena TaxID=2301539 RepID=A0A385D5C1_9CAUD|nr:hypothetical protein HOT92_gp48 [Microbacterium phage Neferthena]AXQ52917.1 hypothetical protein SEA_NEFERTHENA_54 [Microbacterium phage Neferthena]
MNTAAPITSLRQLSDAQSHAIRSLGSVMKYRTATELELSGRTLMSLVELGLVEMKSYRVQSSNPRARVSNEPIIRSYRNSMAGYRLARKGL